MAEIDFKKPIPIVDGFPAWVPIFDASMVSTGAYRRVHGGVCRRCPIAWLNILFKSAHLNGKSIYAANSLEDIKGSRQPVHRVLRMLHKCLRNRMKLHEKQVINSWHGEASIENSVDRIFYAETSVVADVMNETFFRLGYDNGWKKPLIRKKKESCNG